MNPLQPRLRQLLLETAALWQELRLPAEMVSRLERLAIEVDQPCEVAVVGRVKAGKSTFINALLGVEDELAKVGATETTATINYFRYGQPNPDRPARCVWRNGACEEVTREFVDSLQGNDIETLRRADGIHHLEYRLLNPYLEQSVLVDTPGLGAVVDDHQNRTAEYMHLYHQLRQRHDLETQELDRRADAIIYLTDAVARVTDRDFLDDFAQVTGGRSRALNAIGVMAQVDRQPEVLARRDQLAAKIARQLERHLNTVLPVSGGLEFALHRLRADDRAQLKLLASVFGRLPAEAVEGLLGSEQLFFLKAGRYEIENPERLLDEKIPWTVFTTIVRRLAGAGQNLDCIERELAELAGFGPLKEVLTRHFFRRTASLRAFKIIHEVRALFRTIQFREIPKWKARDREERAQRERFLTLLTPLEGESAVAAELKDFITRVCGVARRGERLESQWSRSSKEFDRLYHEVQQDHEDFEILELIDKHSERFSVAERDELYALLGRYGFETAKRLRSELSMIEQIRDRQQHWRELAYHEDNAVRARAAARAQMRYGLILAELTDVHATA